MNRDRILLSLITKEKAADTQTGRKESDSDCFHGIQASGSQWQRTNQATKRRLLVFVSISLAQFACFDIVHLSSQLTFIALLVQLPSFLAPFLDSSYTLGLLLLELLKRPSPSLFAIANNISNCCLSYHAFSLYSN